MIAKPRRPGRTSRKSSTSLPARSGAWIDRPVTLPLGRAKLATKPLATGSLPNGNIMGMTDVTCFTAGTAVPGVTITSTFSSTNSAAAAARCLVRLSTQRYSIATVRPSIQPSSPSRCAKAATSLLHTEGMPANKNPTLGILCCACAASGHAAAALPSSMMNSRRLLIQWPRRRGRARSAGLRGQAPWLS
jgi:hypothetical protein